MTRVTIHWLESIRTLVSIGFFAIGLVASTAVAVQAQSGTWANTGTLNTARAAHTATLLQNGQLLITGGEDTARNFLTSAELYSPATGKWTVTGSTATPRVDHTATLLANGEVLVAGGYLGLDSHYQAIYTATAELYNPSTGQWRATGSMTMPRAFHGATLLQSGEVLVAGGTNSDGSSNVSAELYDPSVGTWKATGSMHNNHAAPLTLLQDRQALVADSTGEIYDPSTGQWTVTAKMYYSGHTGDSTALLTSGDVLIYGNHFSCYASEFYNPFTNIWARTLGQCGNSISFGPLTLLGAGKVLLAGGSIVYSGKFSPTANCRLYDPSTNTWLLTGSLKQARRNHTLTLLQNGQALAAGGWNTSTAALASAELYTP